MNIPIGPIVLIAISVICLWWIWGGRERKIRLTFLGRQSLTDDSFYATYFMGSGVPKDVVAGVREVLQEQLNADLSKLSAEDDFSKNLRFFWDYDSMADVAVIDGLEKRFDIRIEDQEAVDAKSVRDIVNLVTRKIQAR